MTAGVIRRVLVANRGEVAMRVIRACDELGVETVLAASQADVDSLPARLATRTLCIGPAKAADSYLNVDVVAHAAVASGCDAVHPGFGFLAEEPRFAEACAEGGVRFIGPDPDCLRTFGDKVSARAAAEKSGLPVIPGAEVASLEEAHRAAASLGYPLMLKASAGGGGKGIRLLGDAGALDREFSMASSEALAAFGDGRVHLERYVEHAKHIEVQVVGDAHGNVLHLGERDCSVQYRYQKIVEEAPCVLLRDDVRTVMCEAAVKLLKDSGYVGVGTVEFLLDTNTQDFYFLEVNPRLQVEHPVTEAITGVDIVQLQLAIAAGEPLPWQQHDISFTGHAIECRVNAQDADNDLRPTPGRIQEWRPPVGAAIRVDTHCEAGYLVPPFYDSMLAKLIVTGVDREAAVAETRRAVRGFRTSGVATNLPVVAAILAEDDFASGRTTTGWFATVYEKFHQRSEGAQVGGNE